METFDSFGRSQTPINSSELAVLILGYQRDKSLAQILQICSRNGITKIYVAIDAPKYSDLASESRTNSIKQVIRDFELEFSGDVYSRFSSQNNGCGVSVLSGCDWMFENEKFGIVIEDDCLPNDDFFKFALDNFYRVDVHSGIAALCGTQFYPSPDGDSSVIKLKYPVFWGWCTTQEAWLFIRERLLGVIHGGQLDLRQLNLAERTYWRAGCRRVLEGYVDTWDTLISAIFLEFNLSIVSSLQSLVINIGNDEVATHTTKGSRLHRVAVGLYVNRANTELLDGNYIDDLMKNQIYKISYRHLVTTKLTFILDRISCSRQIMKPFRKRYPNE